MWTILEIYQLMMCYQWLKTLVWHWKQVLNNAGVCIVEWVTIPYSLIVYRKSISWCDRVVCFLMYKIDAWINTFDNDRWTCFSITLLGDKWGGVIDFRNIAVLTLNMLNCFKDYERCIHISYHILDNIMVLNTWKWPLACRNYLIKHGDSFIISHY